MGVLLVSATSLAQAVAEAEEDSPEYRRTIEQAVNEYKLGNWEEAAALFDRAHRLRPSARTLRGMGLTAF